MPRCTTAAYLDVPDVALFDFVDGAAIPAAAKRISSSSISDGSRLVRTSAEKIAEAQVMDPLLHYNSISVYPRPLMRNLFDNDTYRRMYLAHMRTIMEENFDNQWYAARAQELQAMIDTSVFNDTNKFYSLLN